MSRTPRRNIFLSAIALALPFATLAVSQSPQAFRHHVVFQMSEPEAEWRPLLAHVMNLRAAFQKDGGVEIEIVFFGPGINMLRKSNVDFAENLKRLAGQGVTLSACQNSMRDRGIGTEDLFPFAGQVDSGVAQLARRQEAGWAYIK
ncbi:MAG: DsrE family protein [Acidobacteriota bacterium]